MSEVKGVKIDLSGEELESMVNEFNKLSGELEKIRGRMLYLESVIRFVSEKQKAQEPKE